MQHYSLKIQERTTAYKSAQLILSTTLTLNLPNWLLRILHYSRPSYLKINALLRFFFHNHILVYSMALQF